MTPASELQSMMSVWDQTIGCDNCGRAWWGSEFTDDPTMFHEIDCPCFARRDVAAFWFNLLIIEPYLGWRVGIPMEDGK